MTNDSGHDSDFEPVLKPQPPLDNKSYPTSSRITIQKEIELNRANKRNLTMTLPDKMEPTQKNSKNMVAPMPTDPPTQKRENNSPVPNATNNQIVTPSPLPDKTNHLVPDTMENDSVVPEVTIQITPPADDGKKTCQRHVQDKVY